ncbi:PilN domain-containing protein [Clostridium sp. 19966]|uniref:PilN domain-containing protein n=1 Tax=Clostridium sp. 19966 TaxID=2768166 RepID=UPI0028DFB2D3|nr:PilN domain-containing protein [Clostridium sp. 19966]MDT8715482.1 PilN domain-containing protein [Clostridium sp. 19966]
MRDLNFFLPYNDSKQESKTTNYTIIGIVALLGVFIIGSSIWYGIDSLLLNGKISNLKTQISDTNLQTQYINSEKIQNKNTILNQYDKGAAVIRAAVDNANTVSTEFLNNINAQLPQDVFLTNISISANSLDLSCTASSRAGIAQFEHNLLSLENVSYVNITDINAGVSQKTYTFTAKCTIKGVDKNENK